MTAPDSTRGVVAGMMIAHARGIRLLPVGAIIETPGNRREQAWPVSWFVKRSAADEWWQCDSDGNIPHNAATFPSEAIFLPVLVVRMPPTRPAGPVDGSLLLATLRRHTAYQVIDNDEHSGVVVCSCMQWRGTDHAAHQTEAVIDAAIANPANPPMTGEAPGMRAARDQRAAGINTR